MAIVRLHGKPMLFVTIIVKRYWREVRGVLLWDGHGLTAFDWPDNINWVFTLKGHALIEKFKNHHIFGTHIAHSYKLKYQKQGLPHVHLLLYLHEIQSYLDPTTIDDLISANSPDNIEEPELYKSISGVVVYGTGGEDHPKCPCMTKGCPGKKKCSTGFPKVLSKQTHLAHIG
jgi:hypothetical protein